ncbi:MAG: hypothetical protein B5M53_08610 [Candidatus Cloacimonas sp. 4484_209]|nr:MAG: hypothetical protein B5M53_08610 [Candidatus Cloacimonas sp. 4484_209]
MRKWIQRAVKGKKGIVHKLLKIPVTKPIPLKLLNSAIARYKRKDKLSKTELRNYRRLVLARTLKKIKKKK